MSSNRLLDEVYEELKGNDDRWGGGDVPVEGYCEFRTEIYPQYKTGQHAALEKSDTDKQA